MDDPYRSADPPICPACGDVLRSFHDRLCCDSCTGVLVTTADLAAVIEVHVASQTGAKPVLGIVDDKPGARACPRCKAAMAITHIDVELREKKHRRLAPTLDRCAKHGIWFDANELAQVLEALQHAAELPGHATLRQIVVTLFENWGHTHMVKWRPLD